MKSVQKCSSATSVCFVAIGEGGKGDVQVCWCLATRLEVRDL
jgi:hypothetical protein